MTSFVGYTVAETLSVGRDWVLYRGSRDQDRRPVIIKAPREGHPSRELIRRLEHEAQVASDLDPRWVVHPLALERCPDHLVLEDCGGEALTDLLDGPMEVGPFLRLAVQMATALAEIHGHRIIHKDIKPSNIIVAPTTGEVRITDFGTASLLPREPGAAESPALLEGTPAYMSPEQTGRMNRAVDHRSDLYSLGITFYEMLTGALPCKTRDPLEWVHFHVARMPRPPIELLPRMPIVLSEIVMRLLAKVAEERYQTALGLLRDLTRCLAEWESAGRVEPFPLGAWDVSDRLEIPQKLYGRERDLAALLAAYDRVAARGPPELVLVSGYSGIGKSSLVQELHRPIVRDRGYFIAGKFDQYKRDIPHATFAQAFRALIQQILSQSEEQIAAFRQRLREALGASGQVIVDVIPELELVIGRQPPVPDLPPAEAQNRLRIVLRHMVGVFARKEHPLALFLDDLQWADSASLALLQDLSSHPEVHHLFIVGAYRDNEVSPAHPLMLALDQVRKTGARTSSIVLGPIAQEDLAAFVGDALHCPASEAAPLAELVHDKTAGNPFFAIQFLTALHEERLIEFDARARAFRWDVAKIHAKAFTDNVVDLMVGKLRRLPAATRTALEQLACLGNRAEISVLTMVHGGSEEDTVADLWEAARAGLVLRTDGACKFLHDRVQEAAYSLVPEAERAAVHLGIGRLLVSHMSEEALAERVFEVVNQLDRGASLVTDPREREALCRLDVLAGTKARAATAYASARGYLASAMALLWPDAWSARYESTFALHLALAECEYLTGNFERADELFDLILRKARSTPDRARAHRLRMRLYQIAGRFDDAAAVTLEALRLFGVTMPASDEAIQAATDAEIQQVPVHLCGRRIADLVHAPMATDPDMRALIGLLAEAMPLVFTTRPALWPLITARGVNLCLEHGHVEESPFVYSCYTMVLTAICRDLPRALEFSEMSLGLTDKLESAAFRGKVLFHHGAVVLFWNRHFAGSLPLLEQAFQALLEVGDLVCAGYLAYNMVWLVWENGDPLDRVIEVARRFAAFARQTHNDVVFQVVRAEEQLAASLLGATRAPASFDDDTFDEASCVAALETASFGLGVACYHIMKQAAFFIHERYAEALAHAGRAARVLPAVAALANEAAHHFYHALTLAALHAQASPEEQQELARALREKLPMLKLWADSCPENFGNRHDLVCAEVARIEGRDTDAMRLYEEAIRSARENGFAHHEAIACEVASRFYRARGYARIADTYLRDARACYAHWGADAKVQQIDRQSPGLFEPKPLASMATFVARPEEIDLLAVIKASQAISGQIVLEELIETLMRVVLENAGAETASLVLVQDGGLALAMVASADGREGVSVRRRDEAPSASELPSSILNYVRRSREQVLLPDATQPNPFSADEHLVRRRPRSVLCLPILRQAELMGILYLENNLVTNAFTPDRLAVLELLAGQAAISLENARLYTDVRRENSERRQAEAALTRAAEDLRASLHEKEVLLKEVYHRVKNNLQLISSLVALQAAQIKDRRVDDAFSEIQNRVRAMALVHESLYRARNFSSIRPADYVGTLCAHLYRSYSVDPERIVLDLRIADVPLDLDRSLRCGLIINELVSNAIKHAFPGGRAGRITVRFEIVPGGYSLSVADDGVGLPPGFELDRSDSLGLQLVADLTDQLGEPLAIARAGGTTFTIRFRDSGEGAPSSRPAAAGHPGEPR